MRKLTLLVILLAIFAFSTALYFLITHFNPPVENVQQIQTVSVTPVYTTAPTQAIQSPIQTAFCQQDQLTTQLSAQGAAGNIYANLELTNTGKTSCEIVLGNTVTAEITVNNVLLHQEQSASSENFTLTPGAKVYSQIHYPNGPQCQSGIMPLPIIFIYKTAETSVPFIPDARTGKLLVQACRSDAEKTTIDIWPLSKTPISQ
jgi:uncharacterized protein DUF4232